ncbi:16S rRNA (uracil(1498)-N(3))-methyltransferase [Massilia sp. W12]|uniref:16S rRNA (uracil(1498)-N(3))-methyltransferase n=1 Tax=Massilia sp. W12 TaxID=3126507 RepID=UPI0030CEB005
MARFYFPQALELDAVLELPADLAHHVHVLRMQCGDNLTLFHGDGGEYTAQICALDKKTASVVVKTFSPREVELPYALSLAQALPEGSKMDWIIEKAVELGVALVQPLAAARSVVKLDAERAEKRQRHWQGIIIAASEQCGRNRLARLAPLARFEEWTARQDLHRRILLSPRATTSISDWARHHPPQALTLMVGPEGGFSEAEENQAIAHGALSFSLGPRVLRTETAGIYALSALQALWGNQ